MKQIIRRVQSLNQRAQELNAAASQLPQRVAEMREIVSSTSGQLQSLKTDVQQNISHLQLNNEDDLASAISEISSHAFVLAGVGMILDEVDIELSPSQRIVVHLIRIGDAEAGEIDELKLRYKEHHSLTAILSAIEQASAAASAIQLPGLVYHKLLIGLGVVPILRISWNAGSDENDQSVATSQQSSHTLLPERTSYFSDTTPCNISEREMELLDHNEEKQSPSSLPATSPITSEVSIPTDPLARFKIMPKL